jgi:hypothetical protein
MRPLFGAKRGRRALVVVLAASGLTLGMSGISQAAGPDPVGTIYVANYAASAIDVFAPGANGDVAPLRSISGPLTGVDGPGDVAVDSSGDVYSSNFNNSTITEYAPGASGNVAPIRTIGGSLTGLEFNDDMSLAANGTLYVGNDTGGHIVVFAPGASGNVAPIRNIFGSLTDLGDDVDGVGVDATGTLYAANSDESVIAVFAPGANGNVAPVRTISGPLTDLSSPDDVKVGFGGELFVTDGGDSLQVFAPGASGDVAPTRDISGPLTELSDTDDFAVSPNGTMYVSNFFGGVTVYGPTANGNVAPSATIEGSLTTLDEPEGVALAPTPASSSATLTTTTAPSISLGGSTHDTATLAGGNSPTGSLIFKLYKPSDPTCSAAPAYTSPLITVTGDGSYTSSTFIPTATGTYNWVAEYSGDENNAPVSTTCGDPNEQVTVTETAKEGCSISDVTAAPFTDVTTGGTVYYAEDNLTSTITSIHFGNSAPEHLVVRGNGHYFTLTGLTDARCNDDTKYPTGPGNKFNTLIGAGPGTLGTAFGNGKPGYTAHWELSDRGDQFDGTDTGGDTIKLVVRNGAGQVVWQVNGTFTTASQEEIG